MDVNSRGPRRSRMTVNPRALSAMSAPEFLPGGKSSHLTALPPLRRWARARARANQHKRRPTLEEPRVDAATYFDGPHRKPTPFFDLFQDQEIDDDIKSNAFKSDTVTSLTNGASLGGYTMPSENDKEPSGVLSLVKTAFYSFFIDKLYRQMFATLLPGFPGVRKEHEMASAALRREREHRLGRVDGTLLDLKCGSGLFTELFSQEGDYDAIVAVDDSDKMCESTVRRLNNSESPLQSATAVVLADYTSLPFQDSVFDAVHVNAGVHTWSSVSKVIKEVTRTVKPGGTLVATTTCLDEEARKRMLANGVDSNEYNRRRKKAFKLNPESTNCIPFWDAQSVKQKFGKVKDLEHCEVEIVQKTFVMVTCAKKSRRRNIPVRAVDEMNSSRKRKNNAVQVMQQSRVVVTKTTFDTKPVNGVYDTTTVE